MNNKSFILICALCHTLVACGDDASPQPSLTTEEALAGIEAARIAQTCAAAFDCPAAGYKPSSVALWARRYADKQACLASPRLKASAGHITAQQRKHIEEGLQTIDGVAAKRCLDALNAQLAACAFLNQPAPPECREVFMGAREQGQACRYHNDCAEGLECDETGYCEGQCVLRTCGQQTCAGETTCVIDAQGQRACAPPAGVGESCEELPCAQGSSCLYHDAFGADDDAMPPTCVAFGSLADGARCDDDRQCAPNSFCDRDNQCVSAQIGAAGTTCLQGKLPGCQGGLACVDATFDAMSGELRGKCGAPKGAGASCYHDEECGADLRCVGVSLGVAGACSSLRAAGEACDADGDCASGICDVDTTTFDRTCQDAATAQLFSCPL